MLQLIIAIRCDVDDENEALRIRKTIDDAMSYFAELTPTVTSQVSQQIEPPPEPT